MYRCLNDVFGGYCDGTPDFKGEAAIATEDVYGHVHTYLHGMVCVLDKITCGRYLSHKQLCEREGFLGVTSRKGVRKGKR